MDKHEIDPANLIETGDVARLLDVSNEMVRYLARTGKLTVAITLPSGKRLFDRDRARALAYERAIAHERRSHVA